MKRKQDSPFATTTTTTTTLLRENATIHQLTQLQPLSLNSGFTPPKKSWFAVTGIECLIPLPPPLFFHFSPSLFIAYSLPVFSNSSSSFALKQLCHQITALCNAKFVTLFQQWMWMWKWTPQCMKTTFAHSVECLVKGEMERKWEKKRWRSIQLKIEVSFSFSDGESNLIAVLCPSMSFLFAICPCRPCSHLPKAMFGYFSPSLSFPLYPMCLLFDAKADLLKREVEKERRGGKKERKWQWVDSENKKER